MLLRVAALAALGCAAAGETAQSETSEDAVAFPFPQYKGAVRQTAQEAECVSAIAACNLTNVCASEASVCACLETIASCGAMVCLTSSETASGEAVEDLRASCVTNGCDDNICALIGSGTAAPSKTDADEDEVECDEEYMARWCSMAYCGTGDCQCALDYAWCAHDAGCLDVTRQLQCQSRACALGAEVCQAPLRDTPRRDSLCTAAEWASCRNPTTYPCINTFTAYYEPDCSCIESVYTCLGEAECLTQSAQADCADMVEGCKDECTADYSGAVSLAPHVLVLASSLASVLAAAL